MIFTKDTHLETQYIQKQKVVEKSTKKMKNCTHQTQEEIQSRWVEHFTEIYQKKKALVDKIIEGENTNSEEIRRNFHETKHKRND